MSGRPSAEERFWAKVDKGGDCWLWTGTIRNKEGYGVFYLDREHPHVAAHRWAYEAVVGPIPVGLTIDHLCRVTSCVNPAHMEPVTHQVNILRSTGRAAVNAVASHCPQGHEYDEANTYIRPNGQGRGCRACRDERGRRRVYKNIFEYDREIEAARTEGYDRAVANLRDEMTLANRASADECHHVAWTPDGLVMTVQHAADLIEATKETTL